MTDDDIVELLVILARRNIPPDVQELLVYGSRSLSVAPGALKAALEAAGWRKVPEGSVVVPMEPTDTMLSAMARHNADYISDKGPYPRSRRVYRAMLAAANEKPAARGEATGQINE